MFDPVLGRFLQRDPFVSAAASANVYNYLINNPTRGTDPLGTQPLAGFGTTAVHAYVAGLIASLNSPSFAVRQRATEQLAQLIRGPLRELVKQALTTALGARPTLEARQRLEALMEHVQNEEVKERLAPILANLANPQKQEGAFEELACLLTLPDETKLKIAILQTLKTLAMDRKHPLSDRAFQELVDFLKGPDNQEAKDFAARELDNVIRSGKFPDNRRAATILRRGGYDVSELYIRSFEK
jgi:hypothetical protein